MADVSLKSFDTLYLALRTYIVPNPKAVIQIIHGTKEHKELYDNLIKWLNANRYSVYIADLRGHGKSINDNYPLGYLENIDELLKDQNVLYNYIKSKNPNIDIYILAYNFGSIIARLFLASNNEVKKALLISPCAYKDEVVMGLSVGKVLVKTKGKAKFSETLNSYAYLDKDDYICTKPASLELLRNDELCNFVYRNQGLMTILEGYKELHNMKRYNNINKDLKILMMAGYKDKTIDGSLGLIDNQNTLKKAGYQNINFIVYKGVGANILLDFNETQVYFDIITFFND